MSAAAATLRVVTHFLPSVAFQWKCQPGCAEEPPALLPRLQHSAQLMRPGQDPLHRQET